MGQFEKALFHYTVWAPHASTQHRTATSDGSPLRSNLTTTSFFLPRKKKKEIAAKSHIQFQKRNTCG